MIAHPLLATQRSFSLRMVPRGRSLQSRRFPPRSFVACVLLFAFGVRSAAALGSLWLDEIWSLELAQNAHSASAVITELQTDNNHVLNTLYLRVVGPNQFPLVYRLPGVILGTLSVALGGWIAARWGRVQSVTALTLLASSYLFTHYASEARGYSWVLFFVLCGWESMWRYSESPRWTWAACFWVNCAFGSLAHPIFAHFLLAAICWSAASIWSYSAGKQEALRHGAVLFSIPITLVGLQYWMLWRNLDLGGGPPYSAIHIFAQTTSLTVGGPVSGWGAFVIAFAVLIVGLFGLRLLANDRQYSGMLLGFTIAIPIVHAISVRPPFLFPRYFLISVLACIFLLSTVLAYVYRRRRWGRWAFAGLLVAYIGANVGLTTRLIAVGRGQYLAALQFMADTTNDPTVTISSDHNFGTQKLIGFYAPQLSSTLPIQYFDGDRWPPCGPRWLVLHRCAESESATPPVTKVIDGHQFHLERIFDTSILSGWQWWCYRRVP
jgi:hypothetical protein